MTLRENWSGFDDELMSGLQDDLRQAADEYRGCLKWRWVKRSILKAKIEDLRWMVATHRSDANQYARDMMIERIATAVDIPPELLS